MEAKGGTPGERPRHPRLPAPGGGGVVTFLDRTTDARRFRHWEGNVEADYIYTSGVAGERFFVALRDEGRILASRCTSCDLNYLPPRMFCEDCFAELTEYLDVPKTGQLAAVTVAYEDRTGAKLSHPQVWGFVVFKGIRGGLLHRLLVPPARARAGLAVRPKLKPREARTGTIADIDGFEPVRF
ncbi:MAG: Zn-ribbon domain-containing OB-fold protein [Methanobacteriota archaeon]|nr:MAG: Zn-ribbon domain-containing OB-fold protein [Euryarchaeota archaeon]